MQEDGLVHEQGETIKETDETEKERLERKESSRTALRTTNALTADLRKSLAHYGHEKQNE